MAWFLFIDESGQDRGASPYEVLAGIAVEDRAIWNLIVDVHDAEEHFFGRRTTLIQLADIVAYLVSWGVRVGGMGRPARPELAELARGVCDLRYRATRERAGRPFYVWSFAVIDDLRPRDEREDS